MKPKHLILLAGFCLLLVVFACLFISGDRGLIKTDPADAPSKSGGTTQPYSSAIPIKDEFFQCYGEQQQPLGLSRKTAFERISAGKSCMPIQCQMLPDARVETSDPHPANQPARARMLPNSRSDSRSAGF